MSASPVTLRLDEAVELGHAWVQSVADAVGIRVLFIKGPALHRHGLRDKRRSSDIDVLVEPARSADLVSALSEAGWHDRPNAFISRLTSLHSTPLIKDGWPCDIDVHVYFPGFLADPATVFDELWTRRVTMDFGHRECAVPDRAGAVLVLALHSLRGASTQRRHAAELDQLTRIPLTEEERADVGALALATGSAATLEGILPRLGVHVTPPVTELRSAELREWRERVDSGSYGAYFWLAAYRRAGWSERRAIAWRAVWATRHDLLIARPETVDTVAGRLRARGQRWVRGLRSLPRAISAVIRNRAV